MRGLGILSLLVLASCGRLGFAGGDGTAGEDAAPEGPLTSALHVVSGVTSIDVKVCTSRAAHLVHAVSSVAWPADWDRAYLEAQLADGATILASDETEQTQGGCTTVTHSFTQDELALHVYAISKVASTGEALQHAADGQLQPMLEPASFAVTGGHTQRYYVHRPEAYYRDPAAPLPVLVFLAGNGENGDDAGTNFTLMANRGLLAAYTQRQPEVIDQPFLVVAPQCNQERGDCWGWAGQGAFIDEVLEEVWATHVFDENRLYVTGLSTGGEGAFRYAIHSRSRAGLEVAAAVPISSTYTDPTFYGNNLCKLGPVPVWAFHNSDDPTQSVTNSRTLVTALAACAPSPTVAPQLDEGTGGHNAWTAVYTGTHGFSNGGKTSAFAWLLSHTR